MAMAVHRKPAAQRVFWTYWAASTTSNLGSAVTTVALPLTAVLVLHSGAVEMGLLAAASFVAWLIVGLPAGAVVSRWPLRRLQVGMDLFRAAAIASVPIAWSVGELSFMQLLLVALVISFANVFFDVANSTFIPSVVPDEQLQTRNSLMSGTHAGTQLAGPSLGGLLVQLLGAVPALLADTASYLASAAMLGRLPETRGSHISAERARLRTQIREGWHFVTRNPIMRACMWDATACNFVCGGQMALSSLYLVRELHAPPGLVGVLLGAEGVGALFGATVTPRLARAAGSARACRWASVVSVAGAAVIPLGGRWLGLLLFAAGNVIFAGAVVVLSTTTRTYRQIAAPPELLSRVMATVRFVSWGVIPLGGIAAGVIASQIGSRDALVALAAVTTLCPLSLLLSPIRTMTNFPTARIPSLEGVERG